MISKDEIKSFIDRIDRLEEEKGNLFQDIKEIYKEAKAKGFDKKVLKQCVKLKHADPAKVEELSQLLQIYLEAADIPVQLGLFS